MSALPPKAEIGTQPSDVHFVPKADIGVVYSITSSARASSEGGTVRPSILDHLSGDQLFDPRPIFEAVTPGIIEVGRWVVRDRTEAWPRLDALEPILKARPTFPHSGESEPVDPLDVRRDLDVGQGEHIRCQPFRLA